MLVQPLFVVVVVDVRIPAIATGLFMAVDAVVVVPSDQVDVCSVDSVRVAGRNSME